MTAPDRHIVDLEDTSSGEIAVAAEKRRDEKGKVKKPAKPPVKPTAKDGKGGPVPVAGMSKVEAELRKRHEDARSTRKDSDASISTQPSEASEPFATADKPKASRTRRRSYQANQDGRRTSREQSLPAPSNPWDADAYGEFPTDFGGAYAWPPPDSWPAAPTPFPSATYDPGASTAAYSSPYFQASSSTYPAPYMPYQPSMYWPPSPYPTFVPTPFYGYGYMPWGPDYSFYSGYGGYELPVSSDEPASGRERRADKPSTSREREVRRQASRRASTTSTSEYSEGSRKPRADGKPDKKPPKDEPRKRL